MSDRPRPHVPGMPNAAVADDEAPSRIDDAAQPGVPKSLRTKRGRIEAREHAAKLELDTMAYKRTDAGDR